MSKDRDKPELLDDDDYPLVEKIYKGDRLYEVHIDDYGQSYFIVYRDPNGIIKEWGCGTYNFDYRGEIDDIDEYLFGTKNNQPN